MTNRHQEEIVRFFAEYQTGLVALTEQAYAEVGGHYAVMRLDERRRQAVTDSQELTAVLLRNSLTMEEVQQTLQSIPSFAVLNDIVRMAEAQERLLTPFVETHLPDQPETAREILSRMRNLSIRFRRNLAVAHLHQLAQGNEVQLPASNKG